MKPKYPSKEELENVFEFDGINLWRKAFTNIDGINIPKKLVRNRANTKDGYCYIKFKTRSIYYHVVVYILNNGSITKAGMIDHIDGDKINNLPTNLRFVSCRVNQQNQVIHRNGRLSGCTYNSKRSKWIARAKVDGKKIYLGGFDSEQDAHNAYISFINSIK